MSLLKRLLIFAVSCVVFGASWLRDLLRRLAGKPSRGSCVVLYYHAIPEQYRARFEGQMNDVLRFAQPIIAARRTPLEAGKRYAAVTFDDAYESVRLYALPSLRAKGIPSTIFVVPAMCGRTASLSDLSTESVAQREVMSAETVRHLSGELVMIGSHTLTHPYLTKLSREDAAYELAESRRVTRANSCRTGTTVFFSLWRVHARSFSAFAVKSVTRECLQQYRSRHFVSPMNS